MRKKELNIGEQLVTVFTSDIQSGKFDDCIVELPFDDLGSITKFKYQCQCEGHILDGIIATYEHGFEYDVWYIVHEVLQYYPISYAVSKDLFYAMEEADNRNIDKAIKANEKKIVDYLNARNNPVAGSCNGTSSVKWIKPSITTNDDGTITVYCHKQI